MRAFAESVRSALQSIWTKKVRSFLTMLGIIIGVAQIIALVGLGEGVKKDVRAEVTQLGTNLLVVLSGKVDTEQGGFNPSASIGTSTLTEQDIVAIKALPDVIDATPMALVAGVPAVGTRTAPGTIILAVDPSYFRYVSTSTLATGRYFTDAESAAKARVAVLERSAAEALYPGAGMEEVLGKKLTIGRTEFEIVGTTEPPASSSAFGSSGPSAALSLPFATAKDINPTTQIFRIGVKASDDADVKAVKARIQSTLNELHGVEDSTVFTQDDLLAVIDNVLGLITSAVVGLATISLIVGGIGIMNIMLVSVTERTREIGVRKAVGATTLHILAQFLTEAVVLSLLGGAIGVGLVAVASVAVKAQANLTILIDARGILTAVLFSLGVGVVFGLAPAIRAARKDPIEALRYE